PPQNRTGSISSGGRSGAPSRKFRTPRSNSPTWVPPPTGSRSQHPITRKQRKPLRRQPLQRSGCSNAPAGKESSSRNRSPERPHEGENTALPRRLGLHAAQPLPSLRSSHGH